MDTSSMESDSGIARSLGYFPAVVYRWMQRRVRARAGPFPLAFMVFLGGGAV